MKVAATFNPENGQVFQHFGHTQFFKVWDVADGKASEGAVVDNGGFGHHDLAGYLRGLGVEVLILGNRGQGAIDALDAAGIRQVPGVTGSADEAVAKFAAGTLVGNPNALCQHKHDHHDVEGSGNDSGAGAGGFVLKL